MKSSKIATRAVVAVAIPVALLALVYTVVARLPTGLPQARENAAEQLKRVSERTTARVARKAAPRPGAKPADDEESDVPTDYYGACDLALRRFQPGGPILSPGMLTMDTMVAPSLAWSTTLVKVTKPLPHGGTPQDWLQSIEPEQMVGGSVVISNAPFSSIADLGLAERTIYASDWTIPAFQDNWPAGDSGGADALGTAAQVILLRAAARGDAEKVERYLPRCLDLSLRANTDTFGSERRQDNGLGLCRTLAIVSRLVELPEDAWECAAERIEAEHLSGDEVEAFYKAFVVRMGESLKTRITHLPRQQNTLHYFWDGKVQNAVVIGMAPLVRGRIDAYTAVLLSGESPGAVVERQRLWQQLRLAAKAADLDVQLDDYYKTGYKATVLPEVVRQEFPDLYLPVGHHPNQATDWAAAAVAAIRFRQRNGHEPDQFAELMPDFLPDDFPQRSHSGWYLAVKGRSLVILRAAPTDGFGPVMRDVRGLVPDDFPGLVDGKIESSVWIQSYPPGVEFGLFEVEAFQKGPAQLRVDMLIFPNPPESAQLAKFLAGS